jgi:hypothetical protein
MGMLKERMIEVYFLYVKNEKKWARTTCTTLALRDAGASGYRLSFVLVQFND